MLTKSKTTESTKIGTIILTQNIRRYHDKSNVFARAVPQKEYVSIVISKIFNGEVIFLPLSILLFSSLLFWPPVKNNYIIFHN